MNFYRPLAFYDLSANTGNIYANGCLGEMYTRGVDVDGVFQKGVDQYCICANKDNDGISHSSLLAIFENAPGFTNPNSAL